MIRAIIYSDIPEIVVQAPKTKMQKSPQFNIPKYPSGYLPKTFYSITGLPTPLTL